MALLTTTSLLESVETAITAILTGGQSYTIGDRTFNRANIRELMKFRDQLKVQYGDEVKSGARNYARFKEPQ